MKSLKQEEARVVAELKEKLLNATEPNDKEEILVRIEEAVLEFKKRRDAADQGLFFS